VAAVGELHLLGDHAPEGVPDEDGLGPQAIDETRVVVGDVVDAVVGDSVRVSAGGLEPENAPLVLEVVALV
jgi:hypothetical protein